MSDKFAFHVARVNSVSWTPDSSHIGTGSLDGNVIRFGMNGSRNIVKGKVQIQCNLYFADQT